MAIDIFKDILSNQTGLVKGYRFTSDGIGSQIDTATLPDALLS